MKTQIPQRHSLRLPGYDYSQPGGYFITVVTHQRECLFGNIVNGGMKLNRFGEIVQEYVIAIPNHHHNVRLGTFVIMPNHLHAIIFLDETPQKVCKGGLFDEGNANSSLPSMIASFKSFSSRKINNLRNVKGIPVWQRSYYDHIIRNEDDLRYIWQYIEMNPQSWQDDKFHK